MYTLLYMLLLLLLQVFFSRTLSLPTLINQEHIETDPELTAGYVEGDMLLNDFQRNGLKDATKHWPNNTVYYKFFTEFDDDHYNYIMQGMKMIESVSCIRFAPATSDVPYYVNISGLDGGCYSEVGWLNRGAQQLNLAIYPLNEGCFRLGTIIHEFLHTLGFYHQQSAANRDDYVRIVKENIKKEHMNNFNKYTEREVDNFDQVYDYGSVLHYGPYAFSTNGKMTIIPLKENEAAGVMGQRRNMTQIDINKLNIMYRCPIKI